MKLSPIHDNAILCTRALSASKMRPDCRVFCTGICFMYCICPCLCICICIVFDDVKVLDKDPFGSKLLERYIVSITSENNG